MGIYIPKTSIPKSCFECEFRTKIDPDNLMCIISQKTFEDGFFHIEHRDSSCPLIPVPEHGRLIDADALEKMCREMQSIEWNKKASPYSWEHAYEEFENDIDDAPTIIPASKEGEG